MKEENKRSLSEVTEDLCNNMKKAFKPIVDVFKSIEESINPKKEFLVIDTTGEYCVGTKIVAKYQYYTWSELVNLINREGKDNLIIFKIKDEVSIHNEIGIDEEVGEQK